MTEQELRQHRCCFTGHRPEKLDKPEADVIEGLKKEIHTATADGFRTFISGMARGVDLWAAEIVLALRDEGRRSGSSAQVHIRASRTAGAGNGRSGIAG